VTPASTDPPRTGKGRKSRWDRDGNGRHGGDLDQGKPVADRIEETTAALTAPVVAATVAPSLPIVPPAANCDRDSHDDHGDGHDRGDGRGDGHGDGHDAWHGRHGRDK
jgi:hypothetical protein